MSAIPPIGASTAARLWSPMPEPAAASALSPTPASFSQVVSAAVDKVSANVASADNMVRSFTLDDSIPVHQVTFALEQARLSMELMLQVRGRLVEAYQQLMNMQL